MSLPEFQTTSLTREEAINQIIASIAMEELGLSHIINAEGEKLQYVLGTLDNGGLSPSATIDEVLKVNESVRSVLQSAAESQSLLRNKLQTVLSSAVLTGPTGSTGATGATGAGLILPLSSGEAMDISTDTEGNPANPGIVGVNTFNDEMEFTAEGDINLEGSPEVAAGLAFLIPRGGAITDASARFYLTEPLTLTGTTGTVTAQFYLESENEVFERIGGVTLEPELDSDGSPYEPGMVLSVIKNDLDLPVEPGARLLLAFKAHASGDNPAITLTGYANASIGIS